MADRRRPADNHHGFDLYRGTTAVGPERLLGSRGRFEYPRFHSCYRQRADTPDAGRKQHGSADPFPYVCGTRGNPSGIARPPDRHASHRLPPLRECRPVVGNQEECHRTFLAGPGFQGHRHRNYGYSDHRRSVRFLSETILRPG